MILPILLALIAPSQLVINGQWVDTLRPGWRVRAGLDTSKVVDSPATLVAKTTALLPVVATSIPAMAAPAHSASVPLNPPVRDTSGLALVPDSVWIPTLSVRQSEVRDLLPALALQHGINIIMDPVVSGKVSLNLKTVRLRDVLRLVADDIGLEVVAAGGVIRLRKYVAPSPSLPMPICEVTVQDGLVSLDAQGATLDQVVRVLAQKVSMNIVVREQGGSPVRVLLKGLAPRRLVGSLAEAVGLEVREQSSVFTLVRPAQPVASGNGTSGSHTGSLRVWVESDSTVSIEANQAPLGNAVQAFADRLGLNLVTLGALQG